MSRDGGPKKPVDPRILHQTVDSIDVYALSDEAKIPDDELWLKILPDEKRVCESYGSEKRRLEFLRSRWLIRSIVSAPNSLLPDDDGVITWPIGIKGSLTHKDQTIVLAVTTDVSRIHSLGIDLENATRFKTKLTKKFLSANERRLLDKCSEENNAPLGELAAIAFSFKEAIYKCHFPLGRKFFYFEHFDLSEIDYHERKACGHVAIDTSPHSLRGSAHCGRFFEFVNSQGEKLMATMTTLIR